MSGRSVSASRFKAQCLAMLDEVAASGEEIVVTKRGRPVARVVPVVPAEHAGSMTFNVSDDELFVPLEVRWHAVDTDPRLRPQDHPVVIARRDAASRPSADSHPR